MVKVRLSQIPETSGKPYRPDGKKMKTTKKEANDFSDEEDDEDTGDEEKEETETRYLKAIVVFEDVGISMSLFGIESVEKDMQFVEKPKAHWEFGIVINKGIEQSMRFPKVDVGIWFKTEELRDKRWDSMMEVLKIEGVKVIEI